MLPQEGSRECRALDAPAASRVEKNTRVSHHGHAGSPGIPRAMGLTAYFALSPVTGLSCHRRPQIESANLTPASGRRDHTTSPSARNVIRLLTSPASTASHLTSVTIAKRPSVRGGMARDIKLIWVRWKAKFRIFRKKLLRSFREARSRHAARSAVRSLSWVQKSRNRLMAILSENVRVLREFGWPDLPQTSR